jgi:acylphosphatase
MLPGQTDDQLIAIKGFVTGRVQRVGFRWFVQQAATRCGINGTVKNLTDGRVEFSAQGDSQQMERFLKEVRQGPAGSRVDSLVTSQLPRDSSFVGFHIGS